MDIFLDTNTLYNNWFLTNANFKFLLNFISNDGHTLLICDVVKNEIEHKHSEELQKNIKKLKESLDELYKLTNIREKVDTEKFDIKYSILDIFNSGGIDYKEISCDSIPQSTVMYRAINRIRPFQDNEKGYRDTLIWLTLLNYANSEESDNDIIFICENKNDFYDPAKKSLVEFHPDLCKDLLSVNVNKKIVPFLGLSSFISSRIDKDKHAINHNKLEQLIESDIEIESAKYLSNLPSKECFNLLTKINPGLKAFSILNTSSAIIEGIEDPRVISSKEISDNKIYIQYYYNLRIVVLKLTINSEDYLSNKNMIDNKFINIQSHDNNITLEALIRPHFDVSFIFDEKLETLDGFSVNYIQLSN